MMTDFVNRQSIRDALLDSDGACRDFNLTESISHEACLELIKLICMNWRVTSSHTSEGDTIPFDAIADYLSGGSGAIQLIFSSRTQLPSHLQLYLYFSDSHYFIELTFFPEDLNAPHFDLDDFLAFLSNIVKVTNSNQYYLRYENAAWRHGSDDKHNSVIFSHENFVLNK